MSSTTTGEDKPRVDDCFVWSGHPRYARVYARVTAVREDDVVLQCSAAGHVWITVAELPLPDGFVKREWTTAELLETIG